MERYDRFVLKELVKNGFNELLKLKFHVISAKYFWQFSICGLGNNTILVIFKMSVVFDYNWPNQSK